MEIPTPSSEETIRSIRAVRGEPSLNLAIGPSCPVVCAGCYNGFGDSADKRVNSSLITAPEILDFAEVAHGLGIDRTVVSGGDPIVVDPNHTT